MKLLIVMASLMLLAGCVSSGVKVDEANLAKFEAGKTTYAQVLGSLGPPTTNTLMPDGRRMLMYSWVQARARHQNFSSIVGPFIGGADSRSSNVILWISRDGTLETYSASQSQYGVGRNLEAGAVPDQPRTTSPEH